MVGPLHHIVGRGEQGAATEREDHGVGMERTQPAKVQVFVHVQFGPYELCGADDADEHADDPHTTVMMANWRTTL